MGWFTENNLAPNIKKTKYINEEMVESFKFLGTHISEELTWRTNITALVKKAQERLYFLRMLRKLNPSQRLLLSFYRCSIESVLTHGMLEVSMQQIKRFAESYQDCAEYHKTTAACPGRHFYLLLSAENTQYSQGLVSPCTYLYQK